MNLSKLPLLLRSGLTLSLFGVLLLGTPAVAGDSAQLNVIGFSEDGSIFAFEEYGIQDGSGFAYSNVYFIDTKEDRFLPGTPIKVLVQDETSVATIRKQAHGLADGLITHYQLENNPGFVVAYNPVSEADSDPHRLRYYKFPVSPPVGPTYTMELTEKVFPAPKTCLNMTGSFSGFSLSLAEPSKQLIYEDKQVPASRSCPNGYRLAAVVTSMQSAAPDMAMIQVSSFGFEGNDERWIAVPVHSTGTP